MGEGSACGSFRSVTDVSSSPSRGRGEACGGSPTTVRAGPALRLAGLVGLALGVATLPGCENRTVVVLDVQRVEVDPSTVSLLEGSMTTLSAAAIGPDGVTLAGREVDWISTAPAVATVDDGGTVRAMRPGMATIRATVDGVTGDAVVTVLAGPSLELDPTSVALRAVTGGVSAVETVAVRNGGNGEVTGLTVLVTYPTGGPSGWLGVSLPGPTAPTALELQGSAAGLVPGVYEATVTVAADGDLSAEVDVTLRVDPAPPEIAVDPDAVGLSSVAGALEPVQQVVSVTNAGDGVLDQLSVRVEYEGTGGWLTAELSGNLAPADLVLRASAQGLEVGVYRATVVISSPAAETDAVVALTFEVGAGDTP